MGDLIIEPFSADTPRPTDTIDTAGPPLNPKSYSCFDGSCSIRNNAHACSSSSAAADRYVAAVGMAPTILVDVASLDGDHYPRAW